MIAFIIEDVLLQQVVSEYFNVSKVKMVKPFGNGLIHQTYKVVFDDIQYILQQINHYVFQSPIGVMYNIDLITEHIRKKVIYEGKNYRYSTLTLVKTKLGQNFVIVDDTYWRCYTWIDGCTYDTPSSPDIFYEAGLTVGQFQELLEDFPSKLLSDNIPHFHDTPYRYTQFLNAVKIDACQRVEECQTEIHYLMSQADQMNYIVDALEAKKIPRRVVHNDTKLNNIMFSKDGQKALCLIDLDTVMKGSLVYDYGDALRLGASCAKEDDPDISKVKINLDLVYAFTKGFLTAVQQVITPLEIDLLFCGYFTITLELGMRFLTDYINGDVYFTLSKQQLLERPKINLERARNQLQLAREIKNNEKKLRGLIQQVLLELNY